MFKPTHAVAAFLLLATPLIATPPATAQISVGDDPQETGIVSADVSGADLALAFEEGAKNEQISALIDSTIGQMLSGGEPVPGWQDHGIDIVAELEALPGGAEANLLIDRDEDILTVLDLSGAVHDLPRELHSFEIRPDPAGLVHERSYVKLMDGFWFETGHQRTREGNALCYGGYTGVNLHAVRPPDQWTAEEIGTLVYLFALVDKLGQLDTCMVYLREDDGGYTSRYFTPDGVSLPALNAEPGVVQVLPARELGPLLLSSD